MKKATLIAVGKVKESYLRDGIAEYAKRLSRFCDFTVKEVEESKREDTAEESRALLKAMGDGYNIVADLKGKSVSSVEFAALLENAYALNDRVNLVIGGSRGVSDEVRAKADALVSFGRATFPHQLFRLLLTEQLYRAFTIRAGLPYHK